MKVAENNGKIQVVIRVRPANMKEREQNQRNIIKIQNPTLLVFDPDEDEDEFFFHGTKQSIRDITKRVNKKLPMEFDEIFNMESTNQQIFESSMKSLVDSVMDGFNCSVFVYGATGAGKTFTMLGNDDTPGLTYLTMQYLFDQINAYKSQWKFDIGISYLEVYNELVMNLLKKSAPLKLREDKNGVVVSDLRLQKISNAEELLNLLSLGNRNRTQHPTDANAESSRSHAIFQVHIRMVHQTTTQRSTVKLSMIDLAGSERAASTKGVGVRFKEGANINKSLLALGNCINKLADGCKHIPYRDSNLTRIIKDSLGGNCKTLMIANVSPSSITYEDTYNTLKYASRAKKIKTSVKVNVCTGIIPNDELVKRLNDLQSENDRLRKRVRLNDVQPPEACKSLAKSTSNFGFETTGELTKQLIPEIKKWLKRIDASHLAVSEVLEQYYKALSREKLMKLKKKIRKSSQDIKQQLLLNEVHNEKNERFDAAVEKFNIQIQHQKQQVNNLKTILNEKEDQLKKLNKEINKSEFASILQQYFLAKDQSLDATKANIKAIHVMEVNSQYQQEIDHYVKVISASNTLLQQNYFVLLGNNILSSDILDKFESIKKLNQRQRVTFKNESQNEDFVSLSMTEKEPGLNQTVVISSNSIKRNRDFDIDEPIRKQIKNNTNNDSFCFNVPTVVSSSLASPPQLGELKSSPIIQSHLLPASPRMNAPIDDDIITEETASCAISDTTITVIAAPIELQSSGSGTISTGSLTGRILNGNVPPTIQPKAAPLKTLRAQLSNIKLKNKANLMKNDVLQENSNLLYNRVDKVQPKLGVVGFNINKENSKFAPKRLRTSPKLARAPRAIHSKERKRLATISTSTNISSELSMKRKN